VFVAGQTDSADFPGTTGGAQPTFGGGVYDAFVARLNAALTTLLQATYLGGGSIDTSEDRLALAIHPTTGEVFVASATASGDFPGTGGGTQPASGGLYDAFVARLSATLTTLNQATYLGGDGNDGAVAIALNSTAGEVFVSGFTSSIVFPGTTGGAQPAAGGPFDAFVARLTPDLMAQSVITFAGTPGMPNCHGQSVSALAQQYGGLDAAASALGFPSVQALQDAIRTFCEE
jgi:hypothetical protein